jgi:hypothetical protein
MNGWQALQRRQAISITHRLPKSGEELILNSAAGGGPPLDTTGWENREWTLR